MDKKIIESYITFGINNGYELKKHSYLEFWGNYREMGKNTLLNDSIISIITSKEFIEAISRGLNKKLGLGEPKQKHFEELCKTQALFIAGYGGEETFEDFILELI